MNVKFSIDNGDRQVLIEQSIAMLHKVIEPTLEARCDGNMQYVTSAKRLANYSGFKPRVRF